MSSADRPSAAPSAHGIVREPLAVPVGVLVARFDDERQAPEDALGGIEVVGVLLQADE